MRLAMGFVLQYSLRRAVMKGKYPETRASQALQALVAGSNQSVVAEKVGVGQPTISLILQLKRQPGRKASLAFEKVGIKREWWDQKPRRSAAA